MCSIAEKSQEVVGVKVVRSGCRSIWCPECGPGQGWRLRRRLEARYRAKQVHRVGFATLTCSPAILGDDLEQQFEYLKAHRLIARFVREVRRLVGRKMAYFSVMEFHHRSQQVHFHLMLDGLGRLDRSTLKALQDWCQIHMGTFDYKYVSRERAVGYCVKYLTKGSYERLPDWCLDYEGRIRPYTASHGFWHDTEPRENTEPTGQTRQERTLRYRIEKCGDEGVVCVRQCVKDDGELVQRYSFSSSESFDDWKQAAIDTVASDRLEEVSRSRYAIWLDVEEFEAVARAMGYGSGAGGARRSGAEPARPAG